MQHVRASGRCIVTPRRAVFVTEATLEMRSRNSSDPLNIMLSIVGTPSEEDIERKTRTREVWPVHCQHVSCGLSDTAIDRVTVTARLVLVGVAAGT